MTCQLESPLQLPFKCVIEPFISRIITKEYHWYDSFVLKCLLCCESTENDLVVFIIP